MRERERERERVELVSKIQNWKTLEQAGIQCLSFVQHIREFNLILISDHSFRYYANLTVKDLGKKQMVFLARQKLLYQQYHAPKQLAFYALEH
jgi:hypothetical protein